MKSIIYWLDRAFDLLLSKELHNPPNLILRSGFREPTRQLKSNIDFVFIFVGSTSPSWPDCPLRSAAAG